jgi:hypothetical protein
LAPIYGGRLQLGAKGSHHIFIVTGKLPFYGEVLNALVPVFRFRDMIITDGAGTVKIDNPAKDSLLVPVSAVDRIS